MSVGSESFSFVGYGSCFSLDLCKSHYKQFLSNLVFSFNIPLTVACISKLEYISLLLDDCESVWICGPGGQTHRAITGMVSEVDGTHCGTSIDQFRG